jgi:hypothetical protein
LANLGEATDLHIERYGRVTSVRVRYADDLRVEYGLAPEDWAGLPPEGGAKRVFATDLRVLFERAPTLSRLLRTGPQ